MVSIPRSGFCPFRPGHSPIPQIPPHGFNPSFGILPIQTRWDGSIECRRAEFQSLVRDSAHSDLYARHDLIPQEWFQSLVRDSAHSDSVSCAGCVAINVVSIPRSGFCPFRRRQAVREAGQIGCFNPSFGILPIQTWAQIRFQDVKCVCFNPSFGILPIQTSFMMVR